MTARESVADRDQELDLIEAPAERLEEEAAMAPLTEEEKHAQQADYFAIVAAMNRAFAGEVELDDIDAVHRLREDEQEALHRFQEAVSGRHGTRRLLAEDRLALLGEALAVLQPLLSVGLDPSMPLAIESFHALVDGIDQLRGSLVSLEDAQEELFEKDKIPAEIKPPADEGGEADDGEADQADEAADRPSTLYGAPDEPAVEKPVTPSAAYDGDAG